MTLDQLLESEPLLWSKIDASGDCWQWTGHMTRFGYGRFIHRGGKKQESPHRMVWERLVGPIPEGFQIDHLCRNRACVNPDHLDPVTPGVNLLRGYSKSALRARQTTCRKGHVFDEANTWRDSRGRRYCKTCHADRERRYRKARRDAE